MLEVLARDVPASQRNMDEINIKHVTCQKGSASTEKSYAYSPLIPAELQPTWLSYVT